MGKLKARQIRFCKRGHDKNIYGYTLQGSCKKCAYDIIRAADATPEGYKKKLRYVIERGWRKWGILNEKGEAFTWEDYNRLLQAQEGRCAVCSIHQNDLKKALHVDHNHKTGKVRGLLCQKDNLFVGDLTADGSQKITDYLKRTNN